MVKYRLAEEQDYKKINDFHNRIYCSNRTLEQFYWEFHNCPFGKSIYIIGEDGEKIVGTNCVIPIDLIDSDNRIIRTGKSEDTLVDPDYRGQNIFYDLYQLLFDKCVELDIKVIWGFTSALKPFKKLGFKIPYEHQQSLSVNKVFSSYKYLSELNQKNKLIDRVKILGLCTLSKLKFSLSFNDSVMNRFRISRNEVTEGIDNLIRANLYEVKDSFGILQSSDYQKWRIYENPNYYKTFTFGYYNMDEILQGIIVINSHPNKVAYIVQSSFHPVLNNEEVAAMIKNATEIMFKDGISLIRNWHFNHNQFSKTETEFFRSAGYKLLNRGVGFVWKELNGFELAPEGFNLSRMATQGVI